MSLGGEYGMQRVRARHLEKLALELGLDPTLVLERARALAQRTGDQAASVASEIRRGGITHPIVRKLGAAIEARSAECRAWLGGG